MREKEQADSDSGDSNKNDKDATNTYYWKLVFFGALAFLALIFVSVNLPYLKDRAKFFTENALSLSILIAVIVQAIISNRQWKAMTDGLKRTDKALLQSKTLVDQNAQSLKIAKIGIDAAEKSAIYANRAYVVAKVRAVGNMSYQFQIWIQNLGNTPANNVHVSYAYQVRDKPPHDDTEEPVVFNDEFTKTESLGLIAPDGSHQTIETPRIELSELDDGRLNSGKLKLYCWGRINYEDIFNRKWHTYFCFVASETLRQSYPCTYGNSAI